MTDEERRPQRPGVVARDHERRVRPGGERVAQLLVGRVAESDHLGARGPQRLGGLGRDIAVAQEQDPARRHGSAPYRQVSGGDVERPGSPRGDR